MRNVQEAVLTNLEEQMKQAEVSPCHLVNIKVAIDSLLLKKNSRMIMGKNLQLKKKKNVLYHSAVAVGLSPKLLKVDHDDRPHSHNVAEDLKKRRH